MSTSEPIQAHQSDQTELMSICEALIFASDKPISLQTLSLKIDPEGSLDKSLIKSVLLALAERYVGSAIELVELGSGYRFQTRAKYAEHVARLWDEKPQKYSRALLETLALIAYRQPITRGDIEEIRGVAVSSNIIRTLLEREWVRVIGHREVPGRPAIYGTTKTFLDYFNLNSIQQLPALMEERDLDSIGREIAEQLELETDSRGDADKEASSEKDDMAEVEPGQVSLNSQSESEQEWGEEPVVASAQKPLALDSDGSDEALSKG